MRNELPAPDKPKKLF